MEIKAKCKLILKQFKKYYVFVTDEVSRYNKLKEGGRKGTIKKTKILRFDKLLKICQIIQCMNDKDLLH